MKALRILGVVLAVIGISITATLILVWIEPVRAISLLVYLPGIVVVTALFGCWAGLGSVLVSVAVSAAYRIWFFPLQAPRVAPTFSQTWKDELILLVVSLFVLALMEMHRRTGRRAESGAQQLAAVLDNVSDAVIIFGADFRAAAMNRAAHVLLARPGETLVGEKADDLALRFQFTPDAPAPVPLPASLEAAARAGIVIHEQGTILDIGRKRRIEVLIHAIPWRSGSGEVEGSVVVITDLTAIKDLQMRLLESDRQAAVGRMFSGLSHDFNHVLDIVRRALAVLELHENSPAEERRKYREMIDRAAVDGGRIVRRLRDYLAGGGERGPVDMVQLAEDAIELTRPLWRNRPNLEIVRDLQPVPLVSGQRNDLERVLINLLFNAIEALGTAPGRITVHSEADAGHVRVWVEDTGPGFAPELLPRLFQPYFTTKAQGMGLGLFGAQLVAGEYGGSLTASSQPGVATRFTFELPVPATRKPS